MWPFRRKAVPYIPTVVEWAESYREYMAFIRAQRIRLGLYAKCAACGQPLVRGESETCYLCKPTL